MERRQARVDGVGVQYATVGQGPPLLLIHGWINDHTVWRGVWERLAGEYQCLLVDLPGFGASDKPAPDAYPYDVHAFVRAALAVLDAEGIDRAHVGGHSMGGVVALVLAATQPERVERLVLADAAAYPTPFTFKSALAKLPVLGGFIFKYLYRRAAVSDFFCNEAYSGHGTLDAGTVAYLYDLLDPMPARRAAYASLMRAVTPVEAVQPHIPQVQHKTLVLWGGDDRLIPVAYGQRLARDLSHADLKIIEGACHVCIEEFPEIAAGHIREHLAGALGRTVAV
ncbi:MAG: alpha/beta hydrolase [Myxococcales bacterium]|nr:alpha/beta hydrolase [Myxococcales bacterium]